MERRNATIHPLDIRNYPVGGWEDWISEFKFSVGPSFDKLPTSKKKSLLLEEIGRDACQIYNSFNLDEDSSFDDVITQFRNYFTPLGVRYAFFTRRQKDNETLDEFSYALTIMSYPCHFGAIQGSLVRDIFICNIHEKYEFVRQKILQEKDPTLSEVLIVANSMLVSQMKPSSTNIKRNFKQRSTHSSISDQTGCVASNFSFNVHSRHGNLATDTRNVSSPDASSHRSGNVTPITSRGHNVSTKKDYEFKDVYISDFDLKRNTCPKETHKEQSIKSISLKELNESLLVSQKVDISSQSNSCKSTSSTGGAPGSVAARLLKHGNRKDPSAPLRSRVMSSPCPTEITKSTVDNKIRELSKVDNDLPYACKPQKYGNEYVKSMDGHESQQRTYFEETKKVFSSDENTAHSTPAAQGSFAELSEQTKDSEPSSPSDIQTFLEPDGERSSTRGDSKYASDSIVSGKGIQLLNISDGLDIASAANKTADDQLIESKLCQEPPVPTSCFTEVVIVYISENDDTIYVCPSQYVRTLKNIEADLKSKHSSLSNVQKVTLGERYASPWNGEWYRAEVMSANIKDKVVRVTFCEYGNEEDVLLTDLRVLPDELRTLKPLSFPIKLPNGAPAVVTGSVLKIRPLSLGQDWAWAVELRTA